MRPDLFKEIFFGESAAEFEKAGRGGRCSRGLSVYPKGGRRFGSEAE
jgi:hypothetical protein